MPTHSSLTGVRAGKELTRSDQGEKARALSLQALLLLFFSASTFSYFPLCILSVVMGRKGHWTVGETNKRTKNPPPPPFWTKKKTSFGYTEKSFVFKAWPTIHDGWFWYTQRKVLHCRMNGRNPIPTPNPPKKNQLLAQLLVFFLPVCQSLTYWNVILDTQELKYHNFRGERDTHARAGARTHASVLFSSINCTYALLLVERKKFFCMSSRVISCLLLVLTYLCVIGPDLSSGRRARTRTRRTSASLVCVKRKKKMTSGVSAATNNEFFKYCVQRLLELFSA